MNKTFIAVLVLAATISFIPLAISQSNSGSEDAGMMSAEGSSQPINTDAIMASGVVAEGHWIDFEKPDDAELQATLTPLQYRVTQHEGTERSFNNTYWDNEEDGIYVDIVSGEPLFSSTHKYKSGTGWPTFWQPLEADLVTEHEDRKLFRVRTEIRSKYGDNHIGHVFTDGPAPTGLRYCMNSAALKFIPQADLEAQGYGAYTTLFN